MTDSRRQIVIASGNEGKIREIARLLEPLQFAVVSQASRGVPSPEETGTSFVENALIKARHAAKVSRLPALADDSGLCVDALDGRPGVRSARYAGPGASDADNIERLLADLSGIAEAERGAAFHCAAVFVRDADDDAPLIAEGRWPGRILEARRGDGGFGYDPVFLDVESGRTAAEMSAAEKNARSHRGRAMRHLRDRLTSRLASAWPS